MAISTIQEVIDRANVSIYLAGNDNAKGSLFGKRLASPGSPVTIALICDALTWGRDGGAQTAADLRQMANYEEWLIGMYGQQAQAIIDGTSGGGSVVPGGGSSVSGYYVIQTGVTGAAGQPVAGESTYQDDLMIGATQLAYIIWNNATLTVGMGDFTFDSVTGTVSLQNGNVWALSDRLEIPFVRA